MPDKILSPSMMCAHPGQLTSTLSVFEKCAVEYLHIDIMDGVFVKNFTLGTDYCRALREMTSIPLDIHLMITEPEQKIDWFDPRPGDFVSVHAESTSHLCRALERIRSFGAKAIAALNPATPLSTLDYVLDRIDGVLIMTVNPGYAGQKMIPSSLKKIADTRRYLDSRGYGHVRIEADGNVSFANAAKMASAGADMFVCGSSSVFLDHDIEKNINTIRRCIRLQSDSSTEAIR